jgi:hypothetical protein
MKLIYLLGLAAGWTYLADTFHWSRFTLVVVLSMTITFAIYVSRVVEDDRQ